ncbi:MAG: hypothetical protein KAX56_02335 [Phenylobacterium sp.]|nr:hypothetical protein [Phenylobacterium sp.]
MKTFCAPLAIACAMTASAVAAQPLAAGANLGTPGVGFQVTTQLSERLVLRGALDGMSLNRDEAYSDIAYDGKARLATVGLFADLHPGGGAFFLSGGAYAGKRELKLSATPTANVEVGAATYTPAQVGRIDGVAKLSNLQPFLGAGFDNTYSGDRAWGFRALVGVSFGKAPKVSLTSTGGVLSSDPTLQANLRAEEAQAREDAKDFKYFPVVQIGLTRRF